MKHLTENSKIQMLLKGMQSRHADPFAAGRLRLILFGKGQVQRVDAK